MAVLIVMSVVPFVLKGVKMKFGYVVEKLAFELKENEFDLLENLVEPLDDL